MIVPEEYYSSELLSPIWEVLDDDGFKQNVNELPGYNTDVLGTVIATI
ncbi:MAG: hypothetical protein P8Y68_06500 [Anaerolineales bacterium]